MFCLRVTWQWLTQIFTAFSVENSAFLKVFLKIQKAPKIILVRLSLFDKVDRFRQTYNCSALTTLVLQIVEDRMWKTFMPEIENATDYTTVFQKTNLGNVQILTVWVRVLRNVPHTRSETETKTILSGPVSVLADNCWNRECWASSVYLHARHVLVLLWTLLMLMVCHPNDLCTFLRPCCSWYPCCCKYPSAVACVSVVAGVPSGVNIAAVYRRPCCCWYPLAAVVPAACWRPCCYKHLLCCLHPRCWRINIDAGVPSVLWSMLLLAIWS